MKNINSNVRSYSDKGSSNTLTNNVVKYSIREQRRQLRSQERNQRRDRRAEYRRSKRAEKAYNERLWKAKKRELYDYAHSLDFYEEADLHLSNVRKYHTHKDVLKYQNKLRNREYKRLVRLNKKFI